MKYVLAFIVLFVAGLTNLSGGNAMSLSSEFMNGVSQQVYTGPAEVDPSRLIVVQRVLEDYADADSAPRLSFVLEASSGCNWVHLGDITITNDGKDVKIGIAYSKGDLEVAFYENQIGVFYTVAQGDGVVNVFIYMNNADHVRVTDTIVISDGGGIPITLR